MVEGTHVTRLVRRAKLTVARVVRELDRHLCEMKSRCEPTRPRLVTSRRIISANHLGLNEEVWVKLRPLNEALAEVAEVERAHLHVTRQRADRRARHLNRRSSI